MTFPLVQPVLKINFYVTMWDTPDSNGSLAGDIVGGIGSALLTAAASFLAGGFQTIEGLEASNTIETYLEGGHVAEELRFFTRATYPRIVMKRGVTFNTDIWDWHHQVIAGDRKTRKSGTILLLDTKKLFEMPAGISLPFQFLPVAAWTFYNALPEKVSLAQLDAKGGSGDAAIAMETIELKPEKIERMSLSLIPGVADLNSALSGLIGVAGAAATAAISAGVTAAL